MKEFGIADSGLGRTMIQEEKAKIKGWSLPGVTLTQVSIDLTGRNASRVSRACRTKTFYRGCPAPKFYTRQTNIK